jgi:DNA-binding NarL/FixJ family response regulator
MKRENRNGRVENLTDRELQVLQLLGAGMSTRKIADELTLSFKTVETHRENIKRKLGLGDAVELIRYAADWVRGQSFSSSRGIPQAVEEVSS